MNNAQQTLKALYDFTRDNYESLKADYNGMPKDQKSVLPITLFIIGVFANLIEDYEKSQVESEEAPQGEHV
jgi:hypothetical protein